MSDHNQDGTDSTPYPEINRAAGAGLGLIGARRRFQKLARDAMAAFAEADRELRAARFGDERPAILSGFDAVHTAYAVFILRTESEWDDEDGFPEKPPAPPHLAPGATLSNRIDDLLDGYTVEPEDPDFVETTFNAGAHIELAADRMTAKRLLCIAFTWGVDLRHARENPGWARRQGVFPGAEAAPSLACLLERLARQSPDRNAPQAVALRLAANAAGRVRAVAAAYGRACCAEFEYDSALAEV